ncbi:aa3-type cytochrome c oxidase subunit IV [Paracoccus sp. 1_MG-2023]|uniref:aa3-type cytochrome c oxidase subunit IV n=1 Tax=unclassified Paracoccus (in: a-proteobacteria) TaxID=2688777 RepID=UPI001C0A119D|nr:MULTISPECIES: aa3-type cytochrome c oxidase subunit IV [unclassified Paracoccus (in: a-proteobacteria)]MBU2956966.1 aa3-type cytochrome c oxidase subunit IV [Paracoccus sp. C2R09]MDO6668163.1 aa3-type cytochrome c oxidase subunit IV [Paracoccus sp. 1_MG-2023]
MADLDNKPEATQGSMDVTPQKRAFAGLMSGITWVTIGSLVVLVFLALTNL